MAKRLYSPEQIINRLRKAEILLNQGATIGEVSKKIGITEQTYYRNQRFIKSKRDSANQLIRF